MGTHRASNLPPVSVIVPAYNAEGTIERCLQALERQTVPPETYEILVVDDGSSDGTRAQVQTHPGVRLFIQANAGPAAARNLGVAHAQGEIVLFTDADCEPAPDWIERMVAPFHDDETRSEDGIVGVKGRYLTRQREAVARFAQIEYEDKYDHMARERYIDFVDTYAAGYRRDVFLANDGFDPAFPGASVEDQEFSFRLARQGYKMVFLPGAYVYHWGHPHSLTAYWQRKFQIGYWKVVVHKRYPDKLWRDSHTPQVLKAQILLAGLASLGFCGALLWPPLWWGLGMVMLLFLSATLPFAYKAWRKDAWVGIVSPALLLVRAFALGTGFALGLVANLGLKDPLGESVNVRELPGARG